MCVILKKKKKKKKKAVPLSSNLPILNKFKFT